jgi:PAS domain S-box-containing protein
MTNDGLVMDELRLLRQMADTLEAVFWLADAQKPCILYVSPAYDRIWGRDRRRLTAHYHEFFKAIHPEDRERMQEASSRCIAQDQFEAEYRIVRPDGEVRWIRDRGFLIRDQDGVPDQMAGFAEDITQIKQQERDRAALEQERDRFLTVGSD